MMDDNGSVTSEIHGLVAAYIARSENGDASGSDALMEEIELVHPRTNDEWLLLDSLFRRLKKTTWVEIMAERFLKLDPLNVDALLVEIASLCRQTSKRNEASQKLNFVEKLREPSVEWFIQLGRLAVLCRRGEDSVGYFRAAIKLQPGNTAARIDIIHSYINVRNFVGAKAELELLRTRGKGQLHLLLSVIRLAMRMDDRHFALETVMQTFTLIDKANDAEKAYITMVGFMTGGHKLCARFVEGLDLHKIAELQLLKDLYSAIKGMGFFAREREIVNRILEISPGDLDFWELGNEEQPVDRYNFLSLGAALATEPRRNIWQCAVELGRTLIVRR
jgi:hypothetical protein